MNVYEKLNQVRLQLQSLNLKKSGKNTYSGYSYFELSDFVPIVNRLMADIGLCGVVTFGTEYAILSIHDTESEAIIEITSPLADAQLKGCTPIQNLGAQQTYIRRYLWVTALELVETDLVDLISTTTVDGHLEEITNAKSLEELQKVYASAYKALQKDKLALKQILEAKDKRKAEL